MILEGHTTLLEKRPQLLIFIVTGMLVADFVLFGYLPSRQRMGSVKHARAEQRAVIAKASSEGEQLPAFKQQLQKLQKSVANYNANIPSERALGAFLQQIASLIDEHNLREQVVVPGKEVKAGSLNCIPVTVSCKGRLSQLFEFYKQFQRLDRLVRIEQVKLVNDSDFNGEVSMQTEAVIYYKTKTKEG